MRSGWPSTESATAISPDGTAVSLYAAVAEAQDQRAPATGLSTFADGVNDNIDGGGYLQYASGLAVSPDGDHVYVASGENAITSFAWDGGAGALALIETDVTGSGGLLLSAPGPIAVTPDGAFVLVASQLDAALVVLDRDPVSGTLGFVDRFVDGALGVDGLDGPAALAVAPTANGAAAYVSSFENELAVFSETLSGPAPGVAFVEAVTIGELQPALAVSPDGTLLYTSNRSTSRVTAYERDPATGAIGAAVAAITDGDPGVDGLGEAGRVAVSPDGLHLYVASPWENAIVVLEAPATRARARLDLAGPGGAPRSALRRRAARSARRVVPADRVDDAGGLLAAFDLDGDAHRRLHAAVLRPLRPRRARRCRGCASRRGPGRGSGPVGAVVDAHRDAVDLHDLRQEAVHQREREIAVRDRRAEGAVLRALDVDVDPLVVAGRVGELVDAILRDRQPLARGRAACRPRRAARRAMRRSCSWSWGSWPCDGVRLESRSAHRWPPARASRRSSVRSGAASVSASARYAASYAADAAAQLPDAGQEEVVRVAGEIEVREIVERLAPTFVADRASLGVPAQHLRHLEVEEMRRVEILVRAKRCEPRPRARRGRGAAARGPPTRRRRSPALAFRADGVRDANARTHRRTLRDAIQQLLARRTIRHPPQLLEQVVGEREAGLRGSHAQDPVQIVGDVPDLDHLGHAQQRICMCRTCQHVDLMRGRAGGRASDTSSRCTRAATGAGW